MVRCKVCFEKNNKPNVWGWVLHLHSRNLYLLRLLWGLLLLRCEISAANTALYKMTDACKTCQCTAFEPNPWVAGKCRTCLHDHNRVHTSSSSSAPSTPEPTSADSETPSRLANNYFIVHNAKNPSPAPKPVRTLSGMCFWAMYVSYLSDRMHAGRLNIYSNIFGSPNKSSSSDNDSAILSPRIAITPASATSPATTPTKSNKRLSINPNASSRTLTHNSHVPYTPSPLHSTQPSNDWDKLFHDVSAILSVSVSSLIHLHSPPAVFRTILLINFDFVSSK